MLPGIYPQEVIKTIKNFKYYIEIYELKNNEIIKI